MLGVCFGHQLTSKTLAASRNFAILEGFSEARAAFQVEYKNANQAVRACRDLFARDTVYALFEQDRPDQSFTERTQSRLMSFVFNAGQEEYQSIARKIDQSAEDVELIRRHIGAYAYWRYNIQGQLVSGEVQVSEHQGMFIFEHFNSRISLSGDDTATNDQPDHEGYVFALKNRLHFHGMGIKYIRPIIANVVEFPFEQYVDGIVMTVQRNTLALMAARFVMIHEDHVDFEMTEESKGFKSFARKIKLRIERGNSVKGVLITSDE